VSLAGPHNRSLNLFLLISSTVEGFLYGVRDQAAQVEQKKVEGTFVRIRAWKTSPATSYTAWWTLVS